MKVPQFILVLVAVVIGAILYFTPIAPIAEKESPAMEATRPAAEYSILDDVTEIKNDLDSAALAELNGWEASDSEFALDSIIAFYDMIRKPVGSAYYALKRAEKVNTADAWVETGERFLLNAKYIGDQSRKASWFAQAKSSLEKATELAPEDLDIQVDLGVCMIESSSFLGTPPMEGIGILKKVEQQDPNNVKALVNLGYFAIKSGQFDKAEERFAQVLKIDPEFADAYLYMADMHERQKMYKEAIEDLENFKSLLDDPNKAKEVDDYILELSKNI